jgi:hypothetical protein
MLDPFDLEAEVARRIAARQAEAAAARRAAFARWPARRRQAPAVPLRSRPVGALTRKEATA